MNKARFLRYLVMLLLVNSCSLLWEFREIQEIDDWKWAASRTIEFSYLSTEAQSLDAVLLIRHVHGFPFDSLDILCTVTSPTSAFDTVFRVPIKDHEGHYLGNGSVDLWDVRHSFLNGYTFGAGTHHIRFEQQTADPLPLIMEVGLELQPAQAP